VATAPREGKITTVHRILCVDDERSVLQALRRLFMDEEGYEVEVAANGQEALEVMNRIKPDLIISDYRMPEMNGAEFLKRAKTIHPDTTRIILSGYADAGVIVSLINEGEIYKFIPKPWDDAEMLVTIRRALEQHDLQVENKRLTNLLVERNEELRRMNEELEQRVERRTGELLFKNHAYQISKNILDQIPIGILGVSDDGTIVQANQVACELLGEHGSLVGAHISEKLPSELLAHVRERISHPDATTIEGFQQALREPLGRFHALCTPLRSGNELYGTIVQILAAAQGATPARERG
jgi:two-component system NtrC family sensor kinase